MTPFSLANAGVPGRLPALRDRITTTEWTAPAVSERFRHDLMNPPIAQKRAIGVGVVRMLGCGEPRSDG
jgi:hypothetical protein